MATSNASDRSRLKFLDAWGIEGGLYSADA